MSDNYDIKMVFIAIVALMSPIYFNSAMYPVLRIHERTIRQQDQDRRSLDDSACSHGRFPSRMCYSFDESLSYWEKIRNRLNIFRGVLPGGEISIPLRGA